MSQSVAFFFYCRWGLVIHGGIDGYSRLVVFLSAATNNRSETMTDAFMKGASTYGVPSWIRSDHGLENLGVAAFMIAHRGPRRGSIITGRSVHNQRIERLWRDLYQSCTGVYHRLFMHLEDTGQLDLSSDIDVWSLHYMYTPRIQRSLNQFRDAWNNHRLRTESGRTPCQLFIRGVIEQVGQGHRGIDDLFYEPPAEPLPEPEEEYGIDFDGPVPEPEGVSSDLSRVPCPLTDRQLEQLSREIDPLEGNGLGIEIYTRTVAFCIRIQESV